METCAGGGADKRTIFESANGKGAPEPVGSLATTPVPGGNIVNKYSVNELPGC
jgi:hypothetical protein